MKRRSKIMSMMLVGVLALGTAVGLVGCAGGGYKVGIFLYKSDDAYITTVRTALETELKGIEGVEYKVFNGQSEQATQTAQVEAAITAGYDLMVFNVVDNQTDAGKGFAEKATKEGIKCIFFNREVKDDAIAVDDSISYVGTDPSKPGYMIGEMIGEMIPDQAAFDKYDRNNDGSLNYVMLRAEPGNAEADGRTTFSVSEANKQLNINLKTTDKEYLKIIGTEQNAEWNTEKANIAMSALLTAEEANIDLVIANNDDMAMGAIAALEVKGFNKIGSRDSNPDKFIPVFGVDGLPSALQAMKDGQMSGTVKQDGVAMAKAIAAIVKNHMNSEALLTGTDYKFDEGTRKLRIPYAKVV